MSENESEPRFSRKQVVAGGLAGAGALSLPKFLSASDALAAGDHEALASAMAEFFGQSDLPVPPANATVHTSACQFCNVGCGYKVYTWPVANSPKDPNTGGPYPKTPLDGWISPAMVTRASVGGVDSYVAVVPDRDCIVNKGDHSPRGGANALTVYTTRPNPLTNPTERHLHPMIRDKKGGPLRQATWDEALDLVAAKIKAALDSRGPSSIGVWAADHLSPEMNFASTKLFFAPLPRGLYNPALGPDQGVAVRAIHNRPKWNSEHPSLADNFGSANSLLYSYHDFELADTVLYTGTNSYETGTVFYNRVFANKKNKFVVIDPRRTQTAQNAIQFGGVHLQLKPNTDVVLINSLMNVILAMGLQDQTYIDRRTEPATFAQLKSVVTQSRYTPENTQAVTGVSPALVRKAARLLGKPHKTSLLFEKGVIWSGTQNEAVIHTYADLALLLGSVGRPAQVFGRQGGHQSAYMYDFDWPHPQQGPLRRNLWQELQKGTIDTLLVGIANPIRMQQQSTQLHDYIARVPFIADINIRPSDITTVADVVLPTTAWGEYTYTRENLERRVRVNQQFYDPAGEARPEYLVFAQIGKRIADKYGILDPNEWQYAKWEDVFNGMRATAEGRAIGIDTITPAELVSLGTNGIQEPFTRKGNTLTGTERMYEVKFPTPSGRANFVAHDYQWTTADPLAFLPEEIKPNAQYPLFVTTVRYQVMWQSGYTYRWLKLLPQRSVPYMEFMVNPKDAKAAGVAAGDWAELSNQYSATQGVVNVTDEVPPGVVSLLFGWQGATDPTPTGVPAYYSNNLIGGGDLQQASNGAFYKNNRAALKKLSRSPRTAANTPGLSEKSRYGNALGRGSDGDPNSKAKNFVSRPIG